jgi:large subunit ribosomal protein L18
MHIKETKFDRRARRVRFKVRNTERTSLSVYKTNKHIYAQVIDGKEHKTVAAYSTVSKDFKDKKTWSIDAAKKVGEEVAKLAVKAGIKEVVFDRSGYPYHGKVKALAEGARAGGLKF